MKRRILLGCLLALAGCEGDFDEPGADVDGLGDDGGAAVPDGAGAEISQTEHALQRIVPVVIGNPNLGMGYNSVTEELKRDCLLSRNPPAKSPGSASVTFEATIDETTMKTKLGVSGTAKASFGKVFEGEAHAEFVRSAMSSSRSVSMIYRHRAITKVETLNTFAYDTAAVSNWVEECGDQFVKAIHYGGELWILVRVDFASETEKKAFEATVGGKFSWATLNTKLKSETNTFVSSAKIHLEAYQRGGATAELGQVIGGVSDKDNHTVFECATTNLKPCNEFVAQAARYASGAFSTALKDEAFATPIKFLVDDWRALSLGPASQNVPQAIAEARASLLVMYNKNLEIRRRAEVLVDNNYFGLQDPAFIQAVGLYDYVAQHNLDVLTPSIKLCYENLSIPVTQEQGSWCAWFAHPNTLAQLGYQEPGNTIASMDVKPATSNVKGRSDFVQYLKPGRGDWGAWVGWKMCPAGTFVYGYKQKIEAKLGEGHDDTALNAVELYCSDAWTDVRPTTPPALKPTEGSWGTWLTPASCLRGPMIGAQIFIENPVGGGDDVSATHMFGGCLSGEVIKAESIDSVAAWGVARPMTYCPAGTAVCGVDVLSEASQGSADDTAMNGIALACCAYN